MPYDIDDSANLKDEIMDDIKLKSFGSSTTTSTDAGSESVGLDSTRVLSQTGTHSYHYSDILTNP